MNDLTKHLVDTARALTRVSAEGILDTRPVIDLRRAMDIEVRPDPVYGRVFVARDLKSYDPDIDSRMNIQGSGNTSRAAVLDLLDQLAQVER